MTEDEKIQAETQGKAAEKSPPQETPQSNDDSQDRTPPAGKAEESANTVQEAREILKGYKEENEKRLKLIERDEKLEANRMLSGKGFAGKPQDPQYSEEELASRKRIKAVADASGSSWGKKYE